jgi:hypothetical protein
MMRAAGQVRRAALAPYATCPAGSADSLHLAALSKTATSSSSYRPNAATGDGIRFCVAPRQQRFAGRRVMIGNTRNICRQR